MLQAEVELRSTSLPFNSRERVTDFMNRSMVRLRLRVLTATLLYLFLPHAAPSISTCPTSWDPARQPRIRREWGSRCLFVPHQRSTSLFRCVDLCKEHGGVPACIGSAEENNFVMDELAAADDLWLGLYQNETGLGPAKGWGRCVAGDAPNFTNWVAGEPNDFGSREDCAILTASDFLVLGGGNGKWNDSPCDTSLVSVLSLAFSCLCTHGNASAAFTNVDRKALEATSRFLRRLLEERTTTAFSAAVAIAVLPTLLLLGRMGWRRLRRGVDAAPSPGRQGAVSSAAAKGMLRAARASAAGRRLRVSFVIWGRRGGRYS